MIQPLLLGLARCAAAFLLFAIFSAAAVPAAHADPLTYSISVQGGRTVVQGSNLVWTFQNILLSGTPGTDDMVTLQFKDQTSGQSLPDGDFDFSCPHQYPGINTLCYGTYPNYQVYGIGDAADAPAWINLRVSPTATLGLHTILITGTSTGEGIVETTTLTINVLSPSQITLTKNPAYLPAVAIPQKARWENDMTVWGAHWCLPQTLNGILDQNIEYYDGARVYSQIHDYTHDPQWSACASWVAGLYDSFVLGGYATPPTNRTPQSYEVFTKGLSMDFMRTGNANSSKSVGLLAQDWYATPLHATVTDTMRETSYALEAIMDNSIVNGATYPDMKDEVSALLGQLDQLFMTKQYTWFQPFMVGLAMEALIQYYNTVSPDPRIPYYIKQALDGLWTTAWRPDLHGFYYRCYSPAANGPGQIPGCWSPQTIPGNDDTDTSNPPPAGDSINYNDGSPDLNNLISPAYEWMYIQTGDNTYRERADSLYADGVLYNDAVNWAGKEYSQNYRWSFDYVNWRNQYNALGPATVADTVPPSLSSIVYSNVSSSGALSVIADAMDNVYVTTVQFRLDGTTNLGPAILTMPFEELSIPTFSFPNGQHQLSAIAYDAAGNHTESSPVTVTFNNPPNAIEQCPGATLPTDSGFQGCYFQYEGANIWADVYGGNAANLPPVPNFGTLISTEADAAINFDWGSGAPVPGVSNSYFSVIWQGNFSFIPGTYAFTASVDGNTGVRAYIDGQMVYNGWSPQCGGAGSSRLCAAAPVLFTASFVTPGAHLLRVESWHVITSNPPYNYDSVHFSWTAASLADTQAPTMPGRLAATSPTPAQINLTWMASTDNVGVAGYQIIRNGAYVGFPMTPSFSDVGLSTTTTYLYEVIARDAAGNLSVPAGVQVLANGPPSSGPGPGPWAPPALNWPASVPLNETLTVSYGNLPVDHVEWNFVPQDAVSGRATSSSRFSTSGISQTVSFPTKAGTMNPTQQGLTFGTYQVTIELIDANGIIQSQASRSITFVSANLSGVKVYPNPWRSDKHAGKGVTFAGLTVGSVIKLFTVSGRQIEELHTDGPSTSWNLTNTTGDKVAAGIYLYLITDSQGDKVKGKLAVIR